MHEVLVNRLGGLSLPRKSVVRLTDRPDMTLDVYRGRKTTKQGQQSCRCDYVCGIFCSCKLAEVKIVSFRRMNTLPCFPFTCSMGDNL